eukprot:gene14708-16328_t
MDASNSSTLLPISLGLNYQHHHQDLYGILEVTPISLSDLNHDKSENLTSSIYQLENTVCLLNIPDLFLPKDILLYFQYYLSSILTFRIYRHYFNTSYILVLLFATPASKHAFIAQYEDKMISSLYDVNCHFYSIQSFSLQTYYEHLLITSSLQLSALLAPHQIVEAKELLSIVSAQRGMTSLGCGSRDKTATPIDAMIQSYSSNNSNNNSTTPRNSQPNSPHNPHNNNNNNTNSQTNNTYTTNNSNTTTHTITLQRNRSQVQETCPLCLEGISSDCPNIIILYCSHSFHLSCLIKIEGVQCPVCRYEHNNIRAHATTCFLCGYPHQQALPSAIPKALDAPALPVGSPDAVGSRSHVAPHEDVWLCLVCGFTGCGVSHMNHIEEHYHDTLHTYALNVAHPHKVWDFAGNGYVHRLILQRSDEDHNNTSSVDHSSSLLTSESLDDSPLPLPLPPPALPRTKVTEVSASSALTSSMMSGEDISYMRSSVPPLDEETEERILNDKLDQLLSQYQEMFVWRMTQNRLFYEDKLKQIWNTTSEVLTADQTIGTTSSSAALPSASANAQNLSMMENLSWMKNIKVSLIQEEQRLMKQCDVIREKISLMQREDEVSRELHKHLLLNQKEWEDRVIKAKQRFQQTEKTYRDEIPKLQERVNQLMLKLDQSNSNPTTTTTTTITAPPSTISNTPSEAIEMKVGDDSDEVAQSPIPPPNSTSKKSSDKKKRK